MKFLKHKSALKVLSVAVGLVFGIGVTYALGTTASSLGDRLLVNLGATFNNSNTDATKKVQVTDAGDLTMGGNTVIDTGGGWHRSYGNTGWYNGTHGGGWYMQDTTWIRSYNSKNVYIDAVLRADGGLQVGDSGSAFNVTTTGNLSANYGTFRSGANVTGNLTVSGNVAAPSNAWGSDGTYETVTLNAWDNEGDKLVICPNGKFVVGLYMRPSFNERPGKINFPSILCASI